MKSYYIPVLILIILFQQSCAAQQEINKVDPSFIKIELQQKITYAFPKEGVYFSNQFAAARLNNVTKQNDSTFTLVITAENRPINSSPWYAFKIWGKAKKNVYLNLNYPEDKHRYSPKISTNGKTWTELTNLEINTAKDQATFRLQLSADTLIVAAQDLISSSASYQWMDEIASQNSLNKQVIGYSINKKPIVALNSTTSNGKKIIVVLSRQHPPEVTGYRAMQKFVATLLADTELAKKFRKEFELVIIPMINPDGVDEGNWRHSFAGVDLNRDWIDFKQPETKSVRDFLLNKVKQQDAKVYFALDFHSTYSDVLYSNEDNQTPTNYPGLAAKWIDELHAFEGKNKTPVRASGNGGNVSKAWFGKVLNAEALTYEVGDDTPKQLIDQKGIKTAEILMQHLLEKK